MSKNYDAIFLPTGETTSGDHSFPVSKEVVNLFNSGRFGYVFVSGGHGGFSNVTSETITEAEETVDYLIKNQIYGDRIYSDARPLETMGNFTFPLVDPIDGNPSLNEFERILVVGKEGHMWRARDYASLALSPAKTVDFHTIPGEHNNGLLAKAYHEIFMKVLKDKSVEDIHQFLTEAHPFYSKGWYDKSPSRRKLEMALTGISWLG